MPYLLTWKGGVFISTDLRGRTSKEITYEVGVFTNPYGGVSLSPILRGVVFKEIA